MPTIEENVAYWTAYEWSKAGDEWSAAWGDSASLWAGTLMPRLSGLLPTGHILEIAPGYGRVTQYLIRFADRLTAVDLAPRCIRACRRRLRSYRRWWGGRRFRGYVNDGRSLAMVPAGSVDLVVSWDSLVHAEADVVREYLRQLADKLRPGGAGLLHHSNMGAYEQPGGGLSVENPHWRAATMSAAKFRAYCAEFGLSCLNQELIPWGGEALNDCLSLFTRPRSGGPGARPPETRVSENRQFWDEARRMKDLRAAYRIPGE